MKHNKEKLNELVNTVHGTNSIHTGPLRDLVSEITGVDLNKPPPLYKIGQRFQFKWRGYELRVYILATTSMGYGVGQGEVHAINLKTGRSRLGYATLVADRQAITQSELDEVFNYPHMPLQLLN